MKTQEQQLRNWIAYVEQHGNTATITDNGINIEVEYYNGNTEESTTETEHCATFADVRATLGY